MTATGFPHSTIRSSATGTAPDAAEGLRTADDATLRAALYEAELPALLAAVAHLTGDPTLLRAELRPGRDQRLPQGGLSPEQQGRARELAFAALTRFRDAGASAPDTVDPDRLAATLGFLFGDDRDEYLPFLTAELAVSGDPGAPDWQLSAAANPGTTPVVAIIGAGMSGLLAAHRLGQVGIDYLVLEKNDDVGGTWLENSYPGCRVDIPSHLYSYSFADGNEWPQHFSTQPVLLDYFRKFATDNGIRSNIRFGTTVDGAVWSEESGTWTLQLRSNNGTRTDLVVRSVISAVGQLNRPSYPRIAGIDDFTGAAFHSARWDHSVDLTGKRVAVVGTGASALQIVPAIADQVAELTVYQRSAPWLSPTAGYREDLPVGMSWLLQHVPGYNTWYRFWLFCQSVEGTLPYVQADPEWQPHDRSVSALNEELRQVRTQMLADQLPDNPELLAKLVPDYPPGAKRMLRDDGSWVRALERDHVRLVTDPIDRFTAQGIETPDGVADYDVIIYATGFEASRFLTPMTVTGRGGTDLHAHWDGDARAYLGMTVPGFPNFFCIYGPNTNIVVNGSIIFFSECAVQYILGCLRMLLDGGHRALDVAEDVHDEFNRRVDEGNARMVWGAAQVDSWYRNGTGRVSQNWPFSLLEYWQLTRTPDPSDFTLT